MPFVHKTPGLAFVEKTACQISVFLTVIKSRQFLPAEAVFN
jgi:hypothetical protein